MAKEKKLIEVDFSQTEVNLPASGKGARKGSRQDERVVGKRRLDQPGLVWIDMGAGNDDVVLTLEGQLPEPTADTDAPNAEKVSNPEEPTKPALSPIVIFGGRNGDGGRGKNKVTGGSMDEATLQFTDYAVGDLIVEPAKFHYTDICPAVFIKDAQGNVIAELHGLEKLVLTDASGATREFESDNFTVFDRVRGLDTGNRPMKEVARAPMVVC